VTFDDPKEPASRDLPGFVTGLVGIAQRGRSPGRPKTR